MRTLQTVCSMSVEADSMSVNVQFDLDVSPKFKCTLHATTSTRDNRDDLFSFSWNTNRRESKWIELKEKENNDYDIVDREIKLKCIFDQNVANEKTTAIRHISTTKQPFLGIRSHIVSRVFGIPNFYNTFTWIYISTCTVFTTTYTQYVCHKEMLDKNRNDGVFSHTHTHTLRWGVCV